MLFSIVRYLMLAGLTWLVDHGVITQDVANANSASLINLGVMIVGFALTVGWSYFDKFRQGWIAANGAAIKNFQQAFRNYQLLILAGVLSLALTGCAGFLAAVPPLIAAVSPLLTVAAQQTALNAAQAANTGAPICPVALQARLAESGLPPLTPSQSQALLSGLVDAIREIQAATPGSPAAVQARVSQAIVAAQIDLATPAL